MPTKKTFMILDTETVSTARIPFDIAYTIIDRDGNIIEQKNYLVGDVFNTKLGKYLLQYDDFSKNKMDKYNELKKNLHLTYFTTIRDDMRKTIQKYNCTVVAYNAKFDYECLTQFAQSLGFKNFFKKSTEVWDLWNIALHTLCDSRNYVNFCLNNGFFSDKGNLKSSAEIVYRFISKQLDFVESHTALDDTEIEAAIMTACLKRHKKMYTAFVKSICYHPIWKKRCKR